MTQLQDVRHPLSDEALDRLFRTAQTYNAWLNRPVSDEVLRRLYDLLFYEKLPRLFPHNPSMRDYFVNSPELAEITAFRNGTLQGAYFMLAARSLGLDCGPGTRAAGGSGFDNAKVDEEFFPAPADQEGATAEVMPLGRIRSNFLCNLGYDDPAGLFPRSPRLEFAEACQLL